jgi:bla regulator protein blaR1
MNAILNHLWQSTFFAALAALLALALRRHRAELRYRIWLAASLKFALPFSLLISLGARFDTRPTADAMPLNTAVQQFAQSFTPLPPYLAHSERAFPLLPVALALWLLGAVAVVIRWIALWLRVRSALHNASPLELDAPIPVRSSSASIEPGVFGIFRPVLLIPEGIAARLTVEEWSAILAHELCHVRRRDNLAAGFHMLIETVFWFHPMVWWIGTRLVEERESACDEEVLRQGSDPAVYASGILNVCKFYVESPLPCASGVTGADLKKRVAAILSWRAARSLTLAGRLLLACAAAAAVVLPVTLGILHGQDTLKFDIASVKPAPPDARGMRITSTPGNGLSAFNVSLHTLVEVAYNVRGFQVTGGPSWVNSERWEILAKPDHPENSADQETNSGEAKRLWSHTNERLRNLLAERFHLVVRRESKDVPVYHLVLAKSGHKLQPAAEKGGITRDFGRIIGKSAGMDNFAVVLSMTLGRPVINQTGLTEDYAFELKWSEEFNAQTIAKEKGIPVPPDAHPPGAPESDPAGPSLFTAIEKQLGLKLESTKGPVEIIVIESAERPAAN